MNQHQRNVWRKNAERCVYVVEFANGTLKVGQTRRPVRRLKEYATTAATHRDMVTRSWFSDPHVEYAANEQALITYCADRWHVATGKEYFHGADYERVVGFGNSLPMSRLTEADLDVAAESIDAMAFTGRREAHAGLENSADCPWYTQFKRSQAWADENLPEGYPVEEVGRHAWAALPDAIRAYALDLFFVDYWIALKEEAEEDGMDHRVLPLKRGES